MSQVAAQTSTFRGLLISIERFVEASITSTVAWVFGIASSLYLLYLFAELWLQPTARMTALWPLGIAPVNDDWGLTYVGREGAFLALGEAVIVLVALALSMVIRPSFRRLGLLLCLAWPALWATHAVLYASSDPDPRWIALAGGLLFVCACAVHRGARLWILKPHTK